MKEILKKNTKNLAIWTVAWVGTFAILTIGSNELWDSLTLTKIGLVINFAVGIGMLRESLPFPYILLFSLPTENSLSLSSIMLHL